MPCILIAVLIAAMPISQPLQNVVVVRFSLKVAEWRRRAFVNDRNRQPWFAYRVALFQQTLFASLCAQTKPVAAVYLLMDDNDDWLYQKYFLEAQPHAPLLQSNAQGPGSTPEIRPIFSSQAPHLLVALDLLRRGPCENVTLSRIDSDDIVASQFFDALSQDIASALQKGEVFDYVMAAQGYKSNLKQMQRCLYGRSPFLTRYWQKFPAPDEWRSPENPPTVYDVSHVRIREYRLLESLNAQWMQLLHGTNVANGFSQGQSGPLPQDLSFLKDPHSQPIVCEEKHPFDTEWFKAWAGFSPPNPDLFNQAPLPSLWHRLRVAWRRVKGRQ